MICDFKTKLPYFSSKAGKRVDKSWREINKAISTKFYYLR